MCLCIQHTTHGFTALAEQLFQRILQWLIQFVWSGIAFLCTTATFGADEINYSHLVAFVPFIMRFKWFSHNKNKNQNKKKLISHLFASIILQCILTPHALQIESIVKAQRTTQNLFEKLTKSIALWKYQTSRSLRRFDGNVIGLSTFRILYFIGNYFWVFHQIKSITKAMPSVIGIWLCFGRFHWEFKMDFQCNLKLKFQITTLNLNDVSNSGEPNSLNANANANAAHPNQVQSHPVNPFWKTIFEIQSIQYQTINDLVAHHLHPILVRVHTQNSHVLRENAMPTCLKFKCVQIYVH